MPKFKIHYEPKSNAPYSPTKIAMTLEVEADSIEQALMDAPAIFGYDTYSAESNTGGH